MKRCLLLALLFFPAMIIAQSPQACDPSTALLPGNPAKLTLDAADNDKSTSYKVTLTATGKKLSAIATLSNTKDLSFVVPPQAATDTYDISLEKTAQSQPQDPKAPSTAPGSVTAFSPSQIAVQRPVITAVFPAAAFSDNGGTNTVVVLGKGFCPAGTDNAGTNNTKKQFRYTELGTPAPCKADLTEGCYKLNVDSDQQITLSFIKIDPNAGYYTGKKSFVVAINGIETPPATLALISTTASTPVTVAVMGFALILLVIFILLRSGKEATSQKMGGKTYWLSVLFLDVPTNSYSLSKCQFYAWSAAAVIGYLFLAASKSFVQGSAAFPDIPPGLPGIILASVATVVISTGITSAKGDKGAGEQLPNLSDFIASGGVVAPDRLQFAIWTLVGIGTFLTIIFRSDPRDINDLPTIPTGFLQLMGISSAGYLAGKLARKAGPTIAALVLETTASGKLRFQITGSGLSRSALFSIDDQSIFPDTILGKDELKGLPEILQSDPSINDPDFARILAFSIEKPSMSWLGGPHKFTITNPDAQKSTWTYQVFKATSITIVSAPAPAAATVKIEGECLDSNLKVQCKVVSSTVAKKDDVLSVNRTNKLLALAYEGTVNALSRSDVVIVSVTDEAGVTATQTVTVT
jgi:hypothetical protein